MRQLGRRDRRVRCLQRLGRHGLSSACIEGMLSSAAPYLAVIDGDLQHDETLLPQMLQTLRRGDSDLIIGSRYVAGGGLGSWDHTRASISRLATRLSKLVLHADMTDPMSGFFMIRREAFHDVVRQLSGLGFKILVDIFASSPQPLRFQELPYQFRNRQAGESKLDQQVGVGLPDAAARQADWPPHPGTLRGICPGGQSRRGGAPAAPSSCSSRDCAWSSSPASPWPLWWP